MGYKWGNDGTEEAIRTNEDVLRMLDSLLSGASEFWDSFYKDRGRPVPFFVNAPDESLVGWLESGLVKPGRVLELGCGPGRDAIYLAKHGFEVDAVDSSVEAIGWATERAAEAGVEVNFTCGSIFDFEFEPGSYDLVYDSGCFHHIPPHRRIGFPALVARALKTGGLFGLVCMGAAPPEEFGGTDMTDWQVYRDRSMHGGIGYSRERLQSIFGQAFDVIELRRMRKCEAESGLFGEPFLWVGLFRKRNCQAGTL